MRFSQGFLGALFWFLPDDEAPPPIDERPLAEPYHPDRLGRFLVPDALDTIQVNTCAASVLPNDEEPVCPALSASPALLNINFDDDMSLIDFDCCGDGFCVSGSHCVDEAAGKCCPDDAKYKLCGNRCTTGDCCSPDFICTGLGSTCCGDGHYWEEHRHMKPEYQNDRRVRRAAPWEFRHQPPHTRGGFRCCWFWQVCDRNYDHGGQCRMWIPFVNDGR